MSSWDDDLTPREQQVLALMEQHLTNGDIARELGISFETAKSHVSHILAKLGADSRDDAVRAWRESQSAHPRLASIATAVLHLRLLQQVMLAVMGIAAIGGIGFGVAVASGALTSAGGRASSLAQRYAADIQAYRTANLSYASWATGYATLGEAAASSDTVLVGRPISSIQKTTAVGRQPPDAQAVGGLVDTTFTVEVQRTFKGSVSAGNTIAVAQTGGVQPDGQITMIAGSPLLSSDMTYLLFLRFDPESGTYALQGPTARFVITDSRIDSLSTIYGHDQFFDMGIAGMPLANAIAQFEGSPSTRHP